MRKQQQKELRRLEEALLEVENTEEIFDPEEELDWEDTVIPEDYDFYNTDDVDVDLDAYSEDVHSGSRGSGLGIFLAMLLMLGLAACIMLFLRYLEVL